MTAILSAIGGVIFSLISVFFLGKKSGKTKIQNELNKKTLEDVKNVKKVSDESASLNVDQQLDELREDVVR
jgi:hypothetical protein